MARIRSVKPEFWEDETVGLLTPYARLLFIATWNLADDEGLLRWSPAYIKASVFMYDDLGVDQVAEVMGELTKSGLLFAYRAGKSRQDLAYVINFRRHQKINRPQPGKLPPPPIQNRATWWMYAERDRWTCHLCGGEIAKPGGGKDERVNLSLDHLVPRSEGGTDYPSNIAACHVRCNKQRGTKPLPDDMMETLTGSVNESVNEDAPSSGSFTERDTVGREGKGREQGAGVPPSAARDASAPATVTPIPTAQTFVAAYVDAYRSRAGHDPPSRVKGQLARELGRLLGDGIPPDAVKAGFVEWFDANTHPSTLPSFVEVAARGGRARASPVTRAQRQVDQARQTYEEMQARGVPGVDGDRRPPQPELARPADQHPDR